MPLLQFDGCVGDRYSPGRDGARLIANAIAGRQKTAFQTIQAQNYRFAEGYQDALALALPELNALFQATQKALAAATPSVLTMGRCAAALGSLPAVAARYPDAAILWLDAHGDLNTPESSASGYLGGMVISGAAGLYKTGLPAGLALANVMLVGVRDLDPFEQQLIDDGQVAVAPDGRSRLAVISDFIANRPVYVHLDADVLEPGIVPTGFQVEGGLSLEALGAIAALVASQQFIGLEIAEVNGAWPDGREPDLDPLLQAIDPLIAALSR